MSDVPSFTKLVPGFDFLQDLVKNAGAALPNMSQWIAPTLNAEELEKRIEELRTVQFWLEQNARMLGATIQALEVQRMTLSTLRTMNVQMDDLRESLRLRPAAGNGNARASATPQPPASSKPPRAKPAPQGAAAAAGIVDPMQWWGALTSQFATLAANAMKDSAAEAAKSLAGASPTPAADAEAQAPESSAPPGKQAGRKSPAGGARSRAKRPTPNA